MFKNFMKKYGYYLVAIALVLVVGITAGLSTNEQDGVGEPSTPTGSTAVEMVCPMESPEVLKWYSDTQLFYNSTLKQWESHKAVDLVSIVSSSVVAVLDGVITDCSYSYEDGYCITLSHEDGLSTTYCSLAKIDGLKTGDEVKQGQKLGDASNTAANESLEGNHLHFSVCLNGVNVDPANYITFENK